MLQFDLSPLIGAKAGERLTFPLDEGPQQLEDIRIAYLRGWMQFTRVQGGILAQGRIETQVEVECIRCMHPFSYPTALEVEETISLAGRRRPGFDHYVSEEGWFDPLPLLREQVWVTLPMKPLCDLQCRGICPDCGANLNQEPCRCREERVDPRLAVLAQLLEKVENAE